MEKNMINCIECDKKLGIINRYRHPALGKRFLVCGKCYTKIDENMQKWSKYCLLEALNKGSSIVC
jgi:hypothetical protein